MIKKRLFFLFLLTLSNSLWADIYKWVDHQGGIHFTDIPPPGAEKVKTTVLQTYSSPIPKPLSPSFVEPIKRT